MASQGGFAKTMWCGELACELKMKEEAGVSSRCIPLEQEHLGDTCAAAASPPSTWCTGAWRTDASKGGGMPPPI